MKASYFRHYFNFSVSFNALYLISQQRIFLSTKCRKSFGLLERTILLLQQIRSQQKIAEMITKDLQEHQTHLLRSHGQVYQSHAFTFTHIILLWLPSVLLIIGLLKLLNFETTESRKQYVEIPSLIRPNRTFATIISLVMTTLFIFISVQLAINNDSLSCSISFALTALSASLSALLYSDQSRKKLIISCSALFISAFSSQWLFIQSFYLSGNVAHTTWKHFVRNSIGFNEFYLILAGAVVLRQIILYDFQGRLNIAGFFGVCFYETVIVFSVLVGLMIWNVLSYGPIQDLIGHITVCLLTYFVTIIVKVILFHRQKTQKGAYGDQKDEQ